jgi:hypothetical protein
MQGTDKGSSREIEKKILVICLPNGNQESLIRTKETYNEQYGDSFYIFVVDNPDVTFKIIQ